MDHKELKALRQTHRLSQSQAAALVHVTPRTWTRYESGKWQIPDGVVELFCIKIGVPFEG